MKKKTTEAYVEPSLTYTGIAILHCPSETSHNQDIPHPKYSTSNFSFVFNRNSWLTKDNIDKNKGKFNINGNNRYGNKDNKNGRDY